MKDRFSAPSLRAVKGHKGFKHYRDGGRDCVELMERVRSEPLELELALLAMGFSEAQDNFPDEE